VLHGLDNSASYACIAHAVKKKLARERIRMAFNLLRTIPLSDAARPATCPASFVARPPADPASFVVHRVRVPTALEARIRTFAAQEDRSITHMIVHLLRLAAEHYVPPPPPGSAPSRQRRRR
jgi:hypothetical protein